MDDKLEFLQGVVDRIEADLAEGINIAALSRECRLSPWHFQRLFKSLVGDTPGGYMRGRRLTRAAELLLDSHRSIIDVAFSVGFNSHEAFTRSFKGYFKLSPKQFRQERPKVVLNKKPVLGEALYRHISMELIRDPEIVVLSKIEIVGYETTIPSPFAVDESSCLTLADTWMRLIANQDNIGNRIPKTYYGLMLSQSGNFTEQELVYIAGVPVSKLVGLPDGMVSHSFPAQQVAKFDVASIGTETAERTIDYIYGYWLPNSGYERSSGSDYELFEDIESFFEPGIGSKYVIPVIGRA